MERELFDWDEWDGDQELMQFMNCKLKQKIGKFKVGTEFAIISIDFGKGTISLWETETDEPTVTFKLLFKVGEEI